MSTTLAKSLPSPSTLAYQTIDRLLKPQKERRFRVENLSNLEHLKLLWKIDCEAYGDHSITFPCFRTWWQRYPLGNTVVFEETVNEAGGTDDRLIASIGIWPIERLQFLRFKFGRIMEEDLTPVSWSQCDRKPQSCWYASGIVLIEEYRKSRHNPLAQLLQRTISDWLESDHVAFPANIVAVAQTTQGQNILRGRLGFEQWRTADQMPDHCDLYGLKLSSRGKSKQHFRDLLHAPTQAAAH